ncbi:sodium/proton antiporter NhaB [Eisenibacter elegans]|uniref:sodium/proton antiporter NhaB n=1 Tax=Eisenibacter elegans TaxID=997 RepID=UPI0005517B8F|nr:sodium/proton antiporter NhaB [Eisenibacter elegans]
MSKLKSPVAVQAFMGTSPLWYKQAILACLIINPIILFTLGPIVTGWVILVEFIATLALALKCYPLIPGGLLALEAVFMQMVTPHAIYEEVKHNLEVILLLLFMVAGIHFMKDLLAWIFTKIIVGIRSKIGLSLTFAFAGAFLSAWLDALTVTAVMIAVAIAFYNIYTGASLEEKAANMDNHNDRKRVAKEDLEQFSGFLRNLMMHGVVGTALGGVSTQVGEPQNLIIASSMKWSFVDFYLEIVHVSLPVLVFGLLTTIVVERLHIFGYGYALPDNVRRILENEGKRMQEQLDSRKIYNLIVQGLVGLWLIIGLALHLAEVGLIGLSVIVLLTALTGKIDENTIGHAFEEATPFTSLLVVFFVVVAMIEQNHLFTPVIQMALDTSPEMQPYVFFVFSGLLSAISDNVFVGTIYIKQAVANLGYASDQARAVAVAINVGTNIPSIATPNGQAAFLFLLTNAIAVRIKLSYLRMVVMAIPYFIVLTIVSLIFLQWYWIGGH